MPGHFVSFAFFDISFHIFSTWAHVQDILTTGPPERKLHREMFGTCMVLSVDDDPINQMVVENLLTPEGYTVRTAETYDSVEGYCNK